MGALRLGGSSSSARAPSCPPLLHPLADQDGKLEHDDYGEEHTKVTDHRLGGYHGDQDVETKVDDQPVLRQRGGRDYAEVDEKQEDGG